MDYEFGLKQLDDVLLKATYPIEVGDKVIQTGEVIASFDKIQIMNLQEIKEVVAARGGYANRAHVYWETTKEMKIAFAQGIFSKTQLSLLTNSALVEGAENSVSLTQRELVESDENGQIGLKETPSGNVFVYEAETGDKVEFTISGKTITVEKKYTNYIVDYEWIYIDGATTYKIGQKLVNSFVSLEGRVKIKEDITGQVKTGIIKIPKLKPLSNLSIRLGRDAIPMVGNFDGVAVPVGERNQQFVMELHILEDDIDSDI